MSDTLSDLYVLTLADLKQKIRQAQQRAVVKVNTELLLLYWEVGKVILEQQRYAGWGAKVIKRLSADLKEEFPEMKGFSERNLKYMRAFAEAYPEFRIVQGGLAQSDASLGNEIVQGPLAQLTWYHHITLLDKVSDPDHRAFYVQKTIENGWSRNVMVRQIESGLLQRIGKTSSNFDQTLPALQSDLAKATFKSPYVLEFIELEESMKERDLERGLIKHLKHFMLELGRGFSYVGNQYNLKVENDEFFLDLLFFNYKLNRFIVFELKVGDFKPAFTGQLNFYINTIDQQIAEAHHAPTIGILLCRTPNKTVVEYALKGIDKPMGVSEYQFHKELPEDLKAELPTEAQLMDEVSKEPQSYSTEKINARIDHIKDLISNSSQSEVRVKRSAETDHHVLNSVYEPLVKEIERIIAEKEVLVWFMENHQRYFCGYSPGYATLDELQQFTAQNRLGPKLEFQWHLYNFKHTPNHPFDEQLSFSIHFKRYSFNINDNTDGQELIQALYNELPTDEKIAELSHALLEKLLERIHDKFRHIQQRDENTKSK